MSIVGHEKFAINPHEIRLTTICPMAHHADITVNNHWYELGNASRNIAESTDKFPPTPKLQKASKQQRAIKFGLEPPIIAQIPVIKNVKLNAHFRPIISDDIDQNAAPNNNPKFCANIKYGPLLGDDDDDDDDDGGGGWTPLISFNRGNIKLVATGQALSLNQPNPATKNNPIWYFPKPIDWIDSAINLDLAK